MEVLPARSNKGAELERDKQNDKWEDEAKKETDIYIYIHTQLIVFIYCGRREMGDEGKRRTEGKRRQQRRHRGPLTSSTRESES